MSLFPSCTLLNSLHFYRAALLSCCTSFMFYRFHVARFLFCTLFVLHFFWCCSFFMLHFFYIFLFSVLHSFLVLLFLSLFTVSSRCNFFMLHFFHVALCLCCIMFSLSCIIFMQYYSYSGDEVAACGPHLYSWMLCCTFTFLKFFLYNIKLYIQQLQNA